MRDPASRNRVARESCSAGYPIYSTNTHLILILILILRRLSIEDPLADKAGAEGESGQQGAQAAVPAPKSSGSAPPGLEGFSPSKQ